MMGVWRLLGRGLGLGGVDGERVIGGGRTDCTEEGRETIPVLDGVRAMGCLTKRQE
jgi:hypothetical protein